MSASMNDSYKSPIIEFLGSDRTACPNCSYDLRGSLAAGNISCPECGCTIRFKLDSSNQTQVTWLFLLTVCSAFLGINITVAADNILDGIWPYLPSHAYYLYYASGACVMWFSALMVVLWKQRQIGQMSYWGRRASITGVLMLAITDRIITELIFWLTQFP